jgi:membrane protease YdiL (CAAX protease family)
VTGPIEQYGGPPLPPPPPVAPAPPPHRWGLGAFVIAELVFLAVSALVGAVLIAQGPLQTWELTVALGVPTLLAAGVAVLITVLRGNGPFTDLRLRWDAREFGLGCAFGFGGLFLTMPAAAVYVSIVGEDASSAVGDVFSGVTADPLTALLIVLIVVLVAPLCEEVLYRGLLWGGLTRLGANRWVAFAVTTVIFALAHFEWPRALLLLVVALPLGLARVYTDGLLAPIVCHQINNLLPGVGLFFLLTGGLPGL